MRAGGVIPIPWGVLAEAGRCSSQDLPGMAGVQRAAWFASSGQVWAVLMGVLGMERGREQKCWVFLRRTSISFPKEAKVALPKHKLRPLLLAANTSETAGFCSPSPGHPKQRWTQRQQCCRFSFQLVLNPFYLCLELGALHADVRRSGHPAVQGLRER